MGAPELWREPTTVRIAAHATSSCCVADGEAAPGGGCGGGCSPTSLKEVIEAKQSSSDLKMDGATRSGGD